MSVTDKRSPLPDVARDEPASIALRLQWVGKCGIALPLRLPDGTTLPASAEVAVDLPDPQAKGIHMSRLYLLLDTFAGRSRLSPAAVHELLRQMRESHADCQSRAALLRLDFALLQQRAALVTPALTGWKSYPVSLSAQLRDDTLDLRLTVSVAYSSTCPCSAALSRQALQDAFATDFAQHEAIDRDAALGWLARHASVATPHSQRSQAVLSIAVSGDAAQFPLVELIDRAEAALGTAVQTAVRRADEQAFALVNGANLMYVEDAARRLQQALEARFAACSVRVSHFESLHAHDAVATAATPGWQELLR
ncbi:GTP cyclohydrolase FolE2 [Herbaspirillum sp. CAH-3]|uniref:GTP cyclohydrolase FolE2 n=1 Tax=Herbaspirillum sp. CAH-3 TaxID=2605746 RepID=UPI0012ACD103|nr:GTP cyclohydrolase FolE2 [Herbaspirillum sp. CAH-3]MRT28865.1 GTP cyclohydrolase I FolE2 [Herbaspirillum sp. CAH-3]